ncbi:MAG: radical SAM protein [Chloroflexi bacterium]|nr:MAG: radical SAM protein [Chloroflexota bacterium]TMG57540.1 MAG: radical SAM protein [Chloroflexota bacterium]
MSSVVYREVEAKSALNAVKGMPFDWSLNPYVGCPHACRYCFARAYNARYRDRDVGDAFDKNVEIKSNFVERLRVDLGRNPQGSVAIGTATDPYQPIEGKYQLTRRCLEALVDHPMPTSIVTKGPLVVRDIDVLQKLDEKTEVTVYFSVPCVDEEIVRKTEPGTAPPRQRLRALRMLREAGLDAAVLCMPVLPGISDSEESLDAAARAASEAGATAFRHRPLKIDAEIQQYYYDFLATEFPVMVPRYAALYRGGAYPTKDYERELEERIRRVRARYEFRERPARPARPAASETVQLQLAI